MSSTDDIDDLLDEADELLDDEPEDNDDRADDDRDDDLPDADAPTVEVIEDDESYIQSQRLRDIFDARQDVRKQRLKMKIHSIDARKQREVRNAKRVYRAAVENYLSELRPVFMQTERGRKAWFALDFGTLDIHLPTTNKQVGRGTKQVHETTDAEGNPTTLPVDDRPEPEQFDLNGLNYLFDLSEPISVEFEWVATSNGIRGGTSRYTETVRYDIGFDRLDQLMNEANNWLQKLGLDLDLGEDNTTAEFDYSDIV